MCCVDHTNIPFIEEQRQKRRKEGNGEREERAGIKKKDDKRVAR